MFSVPAEILLIRELEPTREQDVEFCERVQFAYGTEHIYHSHPATIGGVPFHQKGSANTVRPCYTGPRYGGYLAITDLLKEGSSCAANSA